MRSSTTAQLTAMDSDYRSVHVKVWLKPSGGSFTDMTDLEGYNWVKSVEYNSSIDNYACDATITLFSGRDNFRLSPLMDGSKINENGALCDASNEVKVEVAILASDVLPQSTDFVEVFLGSVDSVEWPGNEVILYCRDQGAVLDRSIESEILIPVDPLSEATIEACMQDILDSVFGAAVITVFSVNGTSGGTPFDPGDSPGVLTKQYIQKKMSVQQALLVLANQTGWLLGYRWQENEDSFELMFYDPGRNTRARGTITHSDAAHVNDEVNLNGTDYTADGVDWTAGSTAEDTALSLSACLNGVSGFTAWALAAEPAVGTMIFTDQPGSSKNFTIGSTTFTEGTDWDEGSDLQETLESIVYAINNSDEPVTANLRDGTTVKVYADTPGAASDSIVFANGGTPMGNVTFDGSGTLGGSAPGRDWRTVCEYDTVGTAGNAIVFAAGTAGINHATFDGAGFLGGTVLGAAASVAKTFAASDYIKISQLRTSRDNIRNVTRVVYGKTAETRSYAEVSDTASITKHGRRYCEIAEAASSQIDNESFAMTLARSVNDDLKDTDLEKSVELPYRWDCQLGDYYTFTANGIHYDTDQTLAVQSISNTITRDSARTFLRCQGKPCGGLKRWLRLEARGGVANQNPDATSDAPIVTSFGAGMASVKITIANPNSYYPPLKNRKGLRVYMSTSSGFTPGPTNLEYEGGRKTRVQITGLTPGETYYFRLAFIDNQDNEGDFCPEFSVQTQRASPYHFNYYADQESVILNPNFDVRTVGTTMPDSWEVSAGTFGSEIFWDDTIHRTGGHSMHFQITSTETAYIRSVPIPAEYARSLETQYAFYYTGTPTALTNLGIFYRMLDKDEAILSTLGSAILLNGYSASTWYKKTQISVMSNTSCRYVQLEIRSYGGGAAGNIDIYVDRVPTKWLTPAFSAYAGGAGFSVASGSWVTVQAGTENFDRGYHYTTAPSYQFTAPVDGVYKLSGLITFTTLKPGVYVQLRFNINAGTTYYTSPYYQTDGAADPTATAIARHSLEIALSEGDTVTLETYHNYGSSRTAVAGFDNTHFIGKLLNDKQN